MTILQINNKYFVEDSKVYTYDTLPVGTYEARLDEKTGQFFLEKVSDFKIPSKLYGNVQERAERVLKTFLDRDSSTGILLAGDKGSGKTMLSMYVSSNAQKMQIPTILVNSDKCRGNVFNGFVQSINQPVVMIFDEFEKVYDIYGPQKELLTLFDGVYNTKKLFILTANNKHKIEENLINRPGRIYYFYEYNKIEQDIINEYVTDNLVDQTDISGVQRVIGKLSVSNFDVLQAIIEEMNRFNCTAKDAIENLNIRLEVPRDSKYKIKFYYEDLSCVLKDTISFNYASMDELVVYFEELSEEMQAIPKIKEYMNPVRNGINSDEIYTQFVMQDLTGFDGRNVVYSFCNGPFKVDLNRVMNMDTEYVNMLF